jgi:hypothetical protein
MIAGATLIGVSLQMRSIALPERLLALADEVIE